MRIYAGRDDEPYSWAIRCLSKCKPSVRIYRCDDDRLGHLGDCRLDFGRHRIRIQEWMTVEHELQGIASSEPGPVENSSPNRLNWSGGVAWRATIPCFASSLETDIIRICLRLRLRTFSSSVFLILLVSKEISVDPRNPRTPGRKNEPRKKVCNIVNAGSAGS
jgi:hypothetical protein